VFTIKAVTRLTLTKRKSSIKFYSKPIGRRSTAPSKEDEGFSVDQETTRKQMRSGDRRSRRRRRARFGGMLIVIIVIIVWIVRSGGEDCPV